MAERKANKNSSNESRNNNNRNNNKNNRNVNIKGDNKGDKRSGESLDDAKEQAELKKAQNHLNTLRDKNQSLSNSIVELGQKIQHCRDEIGRIKNSRVNHKDTKSEIWASIRKYQDRIKHITSEQSALKRKKDEIRNDLPYKSAKAGLAILIARNYAYYDEKIAKIEEILHMENLSSGEVKMKTTQLEKEKAKRNIVSTYNEICLELQVYRDHTSKLIDTVNSYREKLEVIEKEEAAFSTLIEEQVTKIKSYSTQIDQIKEQRKQNNVEINAAAKVRDEKKAILNKKWDDWKAQQAELRKKRTEEAKARRLEYEQQRKEREEQLLKKQEAADAKKILDEAVRPPYEAEVKSCDFLLKYMKDIKINKQKLEAPLKAFPLDVVIRFEGLSLNAPQKAKDIETSVQALNDKKKYFLELREVTLQQRREKKQSEQVSENIIQHEEQNGEPKAVEVKEENAKVENKVEEKAEDKVEENKPDEKHDENKPEEKHDESEAKENSEVNVEEVIEEGAKEENRVEEQAEQHEVAVETN